VAQDCRIYAELDGPINDQVARHIRFQGLYLFAHKLTLGLPSVSIATSPLWPRLTTLLAPDFSDPFMRIQLLIAMWDDAPLPLAESILYQGQDQPIGDVAVPSLTFAFESCLSRSSGLPHPLQNTTSDDSSH